MYTAGNYNVLYIYYTVSLAGQRARRQATMPRVSQMRMLRKEVAIFMHTPWG